MAIDAMLLSPFPVTLFKVQSLGSCPTYGWTESIRLIRIRI